MSENVNKSVHQFLVSAVFFSKALKLPITMNGETMKFMKAFEDINTVSLVYIWDSKIYRNCNERVIEIDNPVFALFM